jgi:malate/lactate dehydrogenase
LADCQESDQEVVVAGAAVVGVVVGAAATFGTAFASCGVVEHTASGVERQEPHGAGAAQKRP